MKNRRYFYIIIFLLLLVVDYRAYAATLKIAIPEDVLSDYLRFLKGRDPLKIHNFSNKKSRRDVVEPIVLQQSLHVLLQKHDVKFIPISNYSRIINELKFGRVDLVANTLWENDVKEFEDQILISPAVIDEGEFEAGIYTLSENKEVLMVKSLDDLKKFTAVTNPQWSADFVTLQNMGIKNIVKAPVWDLILRMLINKRADFLLAPFQASEDLSFTESGSKFVPIPHIKIALKGKRVFVASKKSPNYNLIGGSFVEGVAALKKNGTIMKAYKESGFYNQKVKSWTKIN